VILSGKPVGTYQVGRCRARRPTPLIKRSSGRFPAPAVIVFAGNCFAVTRHPGLIMIRVAAIFARLVAGIFITERVAASWRCRSRRRGCCRRGCLDWRGRCGCLTSGPRLRNHTRQRGSNIGIRVIAGVVGNVADLGTVTGAQRRSCYRKLHGCQAFWVTLSHPHSPPSCWACGETPGVTIRT